MTIVRRAPAGLAASGLLALGLLHAIGAVTYAGPVPNEVMLVNDKTGKCVTIAGGVSHANNVPSVQFDCDSDPSRRWMLNQTAGDIYQASHPSRTWRIDDVTGSGIYQLRNVRTNKCLTIAGGESHDNNVPTLQFNCDSDQSRRWTIRLKLS